uniref:WAS/WASL interacting protein family member 1 n=1 Tax=Latimeria chalumnae TaxID=7897 RepID=H2ZSF9_LATCH
MPVPPPPPPPPTFSQTNCKNKSLQVQSSPSHNVFTQFINKGLKILNVKSIISLDSNSKSKLGSCCFLEKYYISHSLSNCHYLSVLNYSGGGPSALGGLFQGGMPKLRSAAQRDNHVDSGGSRSPILPPGDRAAAPRPFTPSGAPPRFQGAPIPRNNAPESRSRMPPPKPDTSTKPDITPPPVPNTLRPAPSNLSNRGPPPAVNRQHNTGPPLPSIPPNRSQGTGGGIRQPFSSAPPLPSANRPPLPPAHNRPVDDRPPPPPAGNRPLNRECPPPPPPQNNKPPIPSSPRPSPSFQAPPPPPPNRPGPPPLPPSSSGEDTPRLPQRNVSLPLSASPMMGRSGSLPPPPNERPPPPVRDPPSRSG